MDQPLSTTAKSLIKRLYASYHDCYGLSTTSCQVYDTAWVSMVAKTSEGVKSWLFPESFYYLLKTQSDDGGWGQHPATKTAGILDTAAALLAFLQHRKEPLQIHVVSSQELSRRIDVASASLRAQLASWDDISETNHIGVEMIVPALLASLAKEDASLVFDFPCKGTLQSMNESKLSRFHPESLYGSTPSSAVHSLEAFLGIIDFDRVSHHLFHGSMLASPSSTAAYLIGASQWDEEAEKYLGHVLEAGTGHGDGGISGTFPTTHFEISWTIATLLGSGYSEAELDCEELHKLSQIITQAFHDENGIIGFAPRAPDVDDTAKALVALGMLQKPMNPEPMIKAFEKSDHFATFGSERDPSFTSNCHVLLALLQQRDVDRYALPILKAVEFLCNFWWNSDYQVKDKWHLSHLYPTMLLIHAFTELLQVLDKGFLGDALSLRLKSRVAICLVQACQRTWLTQESDGSWNQMPEQTCYAILALAEACRCCFLQDIAHEIRSAIKHGIQFLEACSFKSMDQNWTSKTAYNVRFVAEAYTLAALKADESSARSGSVGNSLELGNSNEAMQGFAKLLRKTPLFSGVPEWRLRASLVESSLFVPMLRDDRLAVYAREEMPVAEDKYLDMIPFTWVGCNNRTATFAPTSIIYEMMLLSMLGYQTDEFFESVATPAFSNAADLHKLIDQMMDSPENAVESNMSPENRLENGSAILDQPAVTTPLRRFVTHVLHHKYVASASSWDREGLRRELKAFLHAHTTQMELNARFGSQTLEHAQVFTLSAQPFFQWVRTTGADHVACAYSFFFACCLFSSRLCSGGQVFPTVSQKYLGAAAVRHLTTTCRMYNDLGSLDRDTAERNVNSVHFPEFSQVQITPPATLQEKKDALRYLAEYEQGCLTRTIDLLQQDILERWNPAENGRSSHRKMAMVQFYCDVTSLYNQLYVLKDLSSSVKQV
ncbi:hypothetical protein F66182_3359 [Fusarium sp. NRRL 66182]|nr:hypothetical protein F66182_3359 [Fusarium sp. NRRL 66182]